MDVWISAQEIIGRKAMYACDMTFLKNKLCAVKLASIEGS